MLYAIGKWKFNSNTRELSSAHSKKSLPNLLALLLHLLIKHKNKVLTRNELIETLWKDKYVNEDALSRAIAELRKELGESASQPTFIKTVPKKGYVFIHEVILIKDKIKKKINYSLGALLSILVVLLSINFIQQNDNSTILKDKITNSIKKSVRITANQGMENQPQLSLDGTKLAYSQFSQGHWYVTVYDTILNQKQLIIKKPNASLRSPALSHDGNKIIMTHESENNCRLLLIDLITRKEKIFSSCQNISESFILQWEHNNNAIIVSDIESNHQTLALWRIEISDLNPINRQQLTFPNSADDFDLSPHISPDGRYMSFSRGNHSIRNILLIDREQPHRQVIELTDNSHYTVSHTWYDNEHIIMDSDQSGNRQLWLININSHEKYLLGAKGAQFPSVDANGLKFAYQIAHYEANIWLFDSTDHSQKIKVNSTKYDNNPSFSPNGNQFVFSSNRLNFGEIWLFDMISNTEKRLCQMPNTKLSRPIFSKDAKKILTTANNDEGMWTYEYDIELNNFKKINFAQENLAAHYANDFIYAMSKPFKGASKLLKIDNNGTKTELNINGISRFMPLGMNQFVISKANKNGLYLVDEKGTNQRLIIENFPSTALNHWTVSGNDVYYRETNEDPGLWKIDIFTLNKQKVTSHYPESVGPSISISFDQKYILMTKTDRAESDVFLTELK